MANHSELHPIEVLLAVALEVAEAITVLIVALVALARTVARWRPSQAPAVTAPPATTDLSAHGPGRRQRKVCAPRQPG